MPEFGSYESMDMIVAKLPCKFPEEGWARDVFRLQVHLIAANLAVKKGRRDRYNSRTKVVFLSKCRPMMELFRCNDLARQEGDWWFFQAEMGRLEQKVSLPVGSCRLSLPLWGQGMASTSSTTHHLNHSFPSCLILISYVCCIFKKIKNKMFDENSKTRQIGVEPMTFRLGNGRSIH